jgi:catechol 2,3-dioxygenase-like lactoylglutathione lyase family enzyme
MSMTDVNTKTDDAAGAPRVDMDLEVVVIPVAYADRSKDYYASLGWRLDADFKFDNGFRVVQLTPPGSGASVQFGTNITDATPGTAQGMCLVVADVATARDALAARGADISGVFHSDSPGGQFEPCREAPNARMPGIEEHHASYSSYATLRDPDGNTWIVQEVTQRFPGRVDPNTTSYRSVADLADAMRRASVAHGQHEARIGKADPDWPDWYAAYMVAEHAGTPLPE